MSGLLVVLQRHFQRAFDGGGAVVGEEYALQSIGGKLVAESGGQFDRARVGCPQKAAVGELSGLFLNGEGDAGVVVAVDIGPDGGVAVEITPALRIRKPRALAIADDQAVLRMPTPLLLAGKGVPAMLVILLDPIAGGFVHRHHHLAKAAPNASGLSE